MKKSGEQRAKLKKICGVALAIAAVLFLSQHIETSYGRQRICRQLNEAKKRVLDDPSDKASLDEIITIVDGRWSFARTYACSVLGDLGIVARPAIPNLIAALNSGDDVVEMEAARALGNVAIGDARPVDALIDRLLPDGCSTAWAAAGALGKIGVPAVRAIPALKRAAGSKSWPMSVVASKAVAQLELLDQNQE